MQVILQILLMNTLDLLIKCAENRLFQLETELYLIHNQLLVISKIPGLSDIESNCLMLEYNINFVKRKYLLTYIKLIKEKYKEKCSFNESISIHISSIDDGMISSFLFEVSGHQNAISDMTDTTLFNNDGKPESILLSVKRFFPYDMILPFIRNTQFMTKFLKIAFDDSMTDYNKVLKEVLSLFSFNKNNMYTFYIISEVLISYFKPNIPFNDNFQYTDFTFYERCRILTTKDYSILQEKVIKNLKFENKLNCVEDRQYSVRSFSKEINWHLPFDTTTIDNNEQQIFQHIIYELQKISVQSSYSIICLSLLRVSDYLTMTVSALKKVTITGADETFNVLLYIICTSRITNFISILNFAEKNCPSFMNESKIGYLIEQMKSATYFINSITLSNDKKREKDSKSLIIFPFLFQQGATQVLLDENKIEIVLYANETIPAVFKLVETPIENKSDSNKVIGYLQKFDIGVFNQLKDIRLVNTTKGLLPLHFGKQNYEKINDNDYEKYVASMM